MTVTDRTSTTRPRIAIVHEWMVHYGGGVERVATAMSRMYPEAHHFALIHKADGLRGSPLEHVPVSPSRLQNLPLSQRLYKFYLPLMPMAVEGFDLSQYDVVISLSHAVAKGALTSQDQLHICYLQARNLKYAYDDRSMYRRGGFVGLVQEYLLSQLRIWDGVAVSRPDITISNSFFVQRWHFHRHGVDSSVLYPPVDLASFSPSGRRAGADRPYVTVGRLEPYKRVDVIVDAFKGSARRLLVVGEGSQLADLRKRSENCPNIEFAGMLGTAAVADVLRAARAFVFASREDFGIAPLEAQACGVPVIAFGEGGARETVVPWPEENATGTFFTEQTPASVVEALDRFELIESELAAEACVDNAAQFSSSRFELEFMRVVAAEWAKFTKRGGSRLRQEIAVEPPAGRGAGAPALPVAIDVPTPRRPLEARRAGGSTEHLGRSAAQGGSLGRG